MQTVVDLYRAKVASGAFERDAAQIRVAEKLDRLAEALVKVADRANGWGWLLGARTAAEPPRGLYIVGDVGRGKTMLMDLFFETVPVRSKRRVHFHGFMMDVHARVHAWREASKRGLAKGEEPIGPVAAALAEQARLLCFDEFAVTDIADAMILGRLFTHLFREGVTVVTTSNVEPGDLYRDGLNRTLFVPFIALLEARLETVRLDAERDYRFRTLSEAAVWFSPADAAARAALDRAFLALTGVPEGRPTSLPLLGRSIAVPNAAGDVARLPFAALCEAPLGSADFLSLARAFGTVIVDGIRVIHPAERNVAKRFITMIDTFYDERVKLLASAETEPERLYDASEGYEVFEFNRVVSRLHEMRSADYLALPHGHGRTSDNSAGLVET